MKKVRNLIARGLLFIGAVVCAAGCTSMQRMTAGETDRQAMLSELLPKFHRSVYWGKFDEAAEFVDPLARQTFIQRNVANRKTENLVELQLDNVEYGPNAQSATVDVLVKYFKNPTYMVETRKEQETWRFTTGAGWQYLGAEDLGVTDEKGPSTSFRGSM
ncbi:MAG: hypothetical protein U0136_03140 [Bdellovibrionota bacterium]